ncbi:adhesion G protein-coupled receptor L2-like [Branchiostoma floridae x Branchiostoma japonicum]
MGSAIIQNCTQNDRPRCTAKCIRDLEDQLECGVNQGDYLSSVAECLGNVTENIRGGDVISSIRLLSRLTDCQELRFNNESQQITKEDAVRFAQTMVTSGNALLRKRTAKAWSAIPRDRWSEVASGIMDSSERAGILLARTVPNETHWISKENIVMEIRHGSTGSATFPALDKSGDTSVWAKVKDGITLPRTEHYVVSAIYDNIGQYLKPKSVNSMANAENSTSKVYSRIISATLVNRGSTAEVNVNDTVTIVLEHRNETTNTTFCVFWNVTTGNWSEEGCALKKRNRTHTTCECNHLTSFAILVDTTGQQHSFALSVITYIGCIISIVCLFICICTFLGFRRVRCTRTIIHANLCFCLLAAEVVYLVAVDKTENTVVCDVIAIVLHYLFLAVFTWMCVEGVELYVLLVKVFNLKTKRLGYYHLVGYGAPAVVVGISVVFDYFVFEAKDEDNDKEEQGYFDGYGTNTYCWLSVDSYFIWSFVGPMLLVVLVNIGFLAMTMKVICTQKAHDTSNQSEQGTDFRFWIRVSLALVCILGITWVFGVLYVSRETLVFAYVFTISNSFQGLFIFIFHCLLNETVQDEIERHFGDRFTCCSKKKRQKTVRRQTRRTARSPQHQEIWLDDFTDIKDSHSSATNTKDTLDTIDDEGFVENSIYEGGACAEGSVDNIIYEGQPD